MQQQIEEMTALSQRRQERDSVLLQIQDQEVRIAQLKKALGVILSR